MRGRVVINSLKNVAKINHLEVTITNQNNIHKIIKIRLNSVHNLLPYPVPHKNIRHNTHNYNFIYYFVWV